MRASLRNKTITYGSVKSHITFQGCDEGGVCKTKQFSNVATSLTVLPFTRTRWNDTLCIIEIKS